MNRVLVASFFAVVVSVVVACGAACTPTSKAAPKPTRLTFGVTAEPTSLVPLFGSSAADAEVGGLLFRELVARTSDGAVVADLAAKVPALGTDARLDETNRLVVDWVLRSDVRWTDGTPVTSADVVAGWKVAIDEQQPITTGRELALEIAAIDVVDATHFRVTWKKPQPAFATPRVHRVLPAHLVLDAAGGVKPLQSFLRRPIGNGLFVVGEDIAGSHLLFRRRGDLPKVEAAPDDVLVRFLPSTDALTSALIAGDVDATFQNAGLSPTEAARLVADHPQRFTLVRVPGTTWVHLDFNLDDPILGDVRVRRAIAAAIDRRKLVEAVAGDAYDVDEGFVPRLHAAWVEQPLLRVDPRESERLLDEAGFTRPAAGAVRVDAKGQPLRLQLAAASGQRDTERLLALVQGALREVGIDVVLELKPFKVFFAEGARKRALPHMAFYAWVVDLDSVGGNLWRSDRIPSADNGYSGQNLPGWKNAQVTKLLTEAEENVDPALRRLSVKLVDTIFMEELPALSFYFRPSVVVARVGVDGVVPTGSLSPIAFHAAQWRVSTTTTTTTATTTTTTTTP